MWKFNGYKRGKLVGTISSASYAKAEQHARDWLSGIQGQTPTFLETVIHGGVAQRIYPEGTPLENLMKDDAFMVLDLAHGLTSFMGLNHEREIETLMKDGRPQMLAIPYNQYWQISTAFRVQTFSEFFEQVLGRGETYKLWGILSYKNGAVQASVTVPAVRIF